MRQGRRSALLGCLSLLAALALGAPASAAPPPLTASIVGETPNGGGVFRFVQAVAISPGGGAIFAGDMYGGSVQAFNRDGSFRFSLGLRARRREPGRLGVVGGLATDRSGHLYVLDSENDRVQVFDATDGHYLASFDDPTFDLLGGDPAIGAGISASGIAVDQRPGSAPVVFVVDQGNDRIVRFTLDAVTLEPVGSPTYAAPGLAAPQGLTLDPAGTRLYVADDQHHRVLVLDPQSLLVLAQVGSQGSGPGQFDAPYDVAVDAQQPPRLYVADNLNNRVDVFDATSLAYLGLIGGFGRAPGLFSIVRSVAALADDPRGGVLVADSANNRVQAFDAAGGLVAAWGLAGRSPGYVSRPRGVAFGPDGRSIAIADTFDHRIERFDPDGGYGGQLGLISPFNGYATQGAGAGQLGLPSGVAYDAFGNTAVSDYGNDRVVVFGPDGAVLRSFGVANPRSIVAGPAGSLLVAEMTTAGHILQLPPDGGTPAAVQAGLANPKAVAFDGANVFSADDTHVFRAGVQIPPPAGTAAWDHPSALAVDAASATLYVAELRPDTANGARVLRGTPIGGGYDWDVLTTEGAGAAEVNEPSGLALSPDGGTLLIADTSNNRILRLDAPGHGPPPTVRLSVSIDQIARGSVNNDTGIACATDCVQQYGVGRSVTLSATPVTGSAFAGWGGACAGAASAPTCTIAMTAAQSVSASFVVAPPPLKRVPPPPPPAVTVSDVRIAPTLLHHARRADRRRHRKARRETRARVTLRLSRPARVTATVALGRPGVRRGSQCVAPPRRRKTSDRPCTRFVVRPGRRTLTFNSGVRRFTLTPTFAGRRLPLGRYRLALVALDANANRVGPVSRAFRVLR